MTSQEQTWSADASSHESCTRTWRPSRLCILAGKCCVCTDTDTAYICQDQRLPAESLCERCQKVNVCNTKSQHTRNSVAFIPARISWFVKKGWRQLVSAMSFLQWHDNAGWVTGRHVACKKDCYKYSNCKRVISTPQQQVQPTWDVKLLACQKCKVARIKRFNILMTLLWPLATAHHSLTHSLTKWLWRTPCDHVSNNK